MSTSEPAVAIPDQADAGLFRCLVCGVNHSTTITQCDYEPCQDCGYDHAYEYTEAMSWHRNEYNQPREF